MKTQQSLQMKTSTSLRVIGIILGIFLLAFAWWVATHPTSPVVTPEPTSSAGLDISPELDTYDKSNQAAVDSAVDRISRGINEYRNGIKPFVSDITAWGTRFGIIRRQASDLGEKWWGNSDNATEVKMYVMSKFERHLFSGQQINALVESSLNQFRDDLAANQNRLHAEIKAAWRKGRDKSHDLNLQRLTQQVNDNMVATSRRMATDSVKVGGASFIGGLILEESTTSIVQLMAARTAAYMAAFAAESTASAGGATSAGAAGGGAAGSTIGPWGTVIGIAAGITVGIIADWWMTGRLEQRLTKECNEMISGIDNQIIKGTKEEPGLKQVFIEYIRALRTAEEQGIRAVIQETA